LVGVMVAVALLPPSVASALFLGAGDYEKAIGSALLLGLNVVCAILSAQDKCCGMGRVIGGTRAVGI